MMRSVATLARVIATSVGYMLRPLSILPESMVETATTAVDGSPARQRNLQSSSTTIVREESKSRVSTSSSSNNNMVAKLYEFALAGWKNRLSTKSRRHVASPSSSSHNGSRQRMAFISDRSSIQKHHPNKNGRKHWGRAANEVISAVDINNSPSKQPSNKTSLRSLSSQPHSHHSSQNQSPPSSSKLSSSRARNAISLLPSYLIDARSVTKYCPIHAPNGALQLSVAENQLCELSVTGVRAIVEGTAVSTSSVGDVEAGGGGDDLTLVQVLSQLASSTVPRPSSASTTTPSHTSGLVFEKDMIYYQPTQGLPGVRSVMAHYLDNLLLSSSSTTKTFNPENIILGAGCNAVLENLCMCLTEPGDVVMIPTPYYAAFEFDLAARAGCTIIPVNTLNFHHNDKGEDDYIDGTTTTMTSKRTTTTTTIPPSFYYPNKSSLTHAYNLSISKRSRPPRVLLLSHPNNPLGICYPPHVVQECIDWCREHEVHLISDEIYAGSVYRQKKEENGEDTFVSAMSLASGHSVSSSSGGGGGGLGLGPYIHLVYALSKDFALSGLRVGVAYSENEEILFPMQKLNDLCQISSQTQLLVERMLSAHVAVDGDNDGDDKKSNVKNEKFVDVYLKSNRNNIRTRCDELQQCLNDVGIPHLPADSGLFVWMDFREFLSPCGDSSITEETESLPSKEWRERQLYLKLMKEYGLLFTPGMSMRNERAGFFRCVFTAASEEEFELGLKRIRRFVEEQRGVN